MRARFVAAIVLLIPGVVSAQRTPRIGGRGPAIPTALPPQAPGIARQMAYRRLPISVETYPLISRIDAPGFGPNGIISSWTSFGMGTRADYRVTRFLSATLDLTSSFLGGPANTETAELGIRLRPERNERRFYPFADLRAGYVHASDSYMQFAQNGGPFTSFDQASYGGRYSHGPGVIAGLGSEIALTRRFSLTTGMSVLRGHLMTYSFTGNDRPVSGDFYMTSYRYTAGIRYNPVRLIASPPPGF